MFERFELSNIKAEWNKKNLMFGNTHVIMFELMDFEQTQCFLLQINPSFQDSSGLLMLHQDFSKSKEKRCMLCGTNNVYIPCIYMAYGEKKELLNKLIEKPAIRIEALFHLNNKITERR